MTSHEWRRRLRSGHAVACALVLASVSIVFGQARSARPSSLTITHVAVVDIDTGSIQRDVTIVVEGDRIARVGGSGAIGGQQFDARGKYAIPGLWDMHVHLSWATSNALPLFVANGVTGVRDLGSDLGEIDSWRSRIRSRDLVGPRIVRAGPILNGSASNQWQLATGNPEQARGIVRALKKAGVDVIKVHRRVPRDDYFAIVAEAKAQDLPLAGHIPITITPAEASDAGQQIEHVATLFEGTFATALESPGEPLLVAKLPGAIRAFRERDGQALFDRFVRNRTAVTPTLRILQAVADANAGMSDPRLRYVPRSLRDAASKPLPAEQRAVLSQMNSELLETVRMMNRSGVTLLAGTDTSTAPAVPGFYLQDELVELVNAGLTPLQAIRSATLNPAQVIRRNDLGRIAAGNLADIVLVDANPVEDIHNVQHIAAVVLAGKLLRRSDLDRLLRGAEAEASQK